jgi:hypothetical protein
MACTIINPAPILSPRSLLARCQRSRCTSTEMEDRVCGRGLGEGCRLAEHVQQASCAAASATTPHTPRCQERFTMH